MEDYIGKICPFCKTEIKEGDSVKVCPACGIPHHESCWEENHGCTTFGCSEQHYEEQHTNPTDVCQNCGAPLGDGQEFCPKCGAPKNAPKKNVCGKCGAELQEGQEFCPKCGQKVGLAVDTGVNSAISQFNAGIQKINDKKKKKPLIIGIAAAVIVVIVAIVAIGGGGSKGSGVTIEDFEFKVIKEIDDEGVVSVSEVENGFTFEYKGTALLADLVISGTADKNKNITYIEAEAVDGINIDYFNSLTASQFVSDVSDANNVPMNKLTGDFVLWDFSYVVSLCSKDQSSKDQIYGLDLLLAARKSPQEKDGWTYSISTNSSTESITITATYGG